MRLRVGAGAAALALLVAACSNAGTPSGGGSGQTDGVSAHEIRVGGLASLTGPLGDQYAPVFDGAQTYFDMVNAQGGVLGRKIKLVARLDDATDPARDVSQARALVEQHHVFAVIPVAAPLFPAGKYLGDHNIPTFGWNVNAEWSTGTSLFGEKGSFLDFTGPAPFYGYLAKKVGAKRVAILAYTASQSRDCATGAENSFKKYGFEVALNDSSLAFGTTSLDADVQRIKDAHVDLVTTCMDVTGNTLLSKTLKRAGLTNVKQYWPTGYDQEALSKFPDLYEGVYFRTGFVPFEEAASTPALAKFLAEMKKRRPKVKISEVVLAGWENGDLFVRGLRAAGPNPTRQKLIDALNSISDWTADGIEGPIDWHVAHHANNPTDCDAYLQVQNGKFTPLFHQPFVCYPHNSPTVPEV